MKPELRRAARPELVWDALLAVFAVLLGAAGAAGAHFYLADAALEAPLGAQSRIVVENLGDPSAHERVTELLMASTERHGVTLYHHDPAGAGYEVYPSPDAHDASDWHAVTYPGLDPVRLVGPHPGAGPASGTYSSFGSAQDMAPVVEDLDAAGVEASIVAGRALVPWILGGTVGSGWTAAMVPSVMILGLIGMLIVSGMLRSRSLQRAAGMPLIRRWGPVLATVPVAAAVAAASPLLALGVVVALDVGRSAADGLMGAAAVLGVAAFAAVGCGMALGLIVSAGLRLPERIAGVVPVRAIGLVAGAVAVVAVGICGYGMRDVQAVRQLAADAADADAWRAAHPDVIVPVMGYEVRGARAATSDLQLGEVTRAMYAEDRAMLSAPVEGYGGGEAVLIDTAFLAAWRPDLLDRVADDGVTIVTPSNPSSGTPLTATELGEMTQFWAELRGDGQPPAITGKTYDDDVVVPLLDYRYFQPGDSFRRNPVLVVIPDPPTVLDPVQLATAIAYDDAERYRDLVRRAGTADVVIRVESVAEMSARDADRRDMQKLARLAGAVAASGVAVLATAIAAWALARIRRPQVFLRRCVGDGFARIHGGTVAVSGVAATLLAAAGALTCAPEFAPAALIGPVVGAVIATVVAIVLAASFRSTTVIALEEI
ncbi:hypothetical protein KRX51_01075 [Corynebacterium sp. TAE3-ERU12]|uniref:hypothetical protein n=1 Tax=Corynebacterium sp. TAE3-ERU12 TaxID=2849491 RepID=UPI001C48065C|nr:hypothetical protein [Corynebacterium sp. TAE3-ERU12]MBV7294510.1 hypothetical protein [Corynebacterium sp. TAE3-ERU12]